MSINKGTITVIIIMTVIVSIGIIIAYLYYDSINKAEDPRIIEAKYQYKKYNVFVQKNDYKSVFATLDTIENIYSQFADYQRSYEIGVVYNNKSAVWLTSALIKASNEQENQSDLDSAKKYSEKSIIIYDNWIKEFGYLSKENILKKVKDYYIINHISFENNEIDKIIEKRVDDILTAQTETIKRLSVAYTNLGIIQRHNSEYDNAIASYKKALELWVGNRNAKNNVNILLGRPIEEATMIEKLFPEEKDK
ncbi:MAG: tetratricopeptide repeat protein [Bacteroidales bacterium]|nr:tetratricopeptide repeat protein [Bacteroidales bacterium]MBN2756121.1 tetratricopeptide repeat protein [Bacteroidales bacterium]